MRFYTLIVSMMAHIAAIGAVVIVPLMAFDVLPTPQTGLSAVQLPITVAPPPRTRPVRPAPQSTVSRAAATIEAPRGVAPEPVQPEPDPFDEGPASGLIVGGDVFGSTFAPPPEPPPPPPPPATSVHEPVRVGGLVTPPERVAFVAPVYSEIARSVRVEGTVILEATIGTDGNVTGVQVLRSVPLLDEAARQAVRQWRFTPTLLNGERVPVVMTVTVTFRLR